jgi:hypothetical protein
MKPCKNSTLTEEISGKATTEFGKSISLDE